MVESEREKRKREKERERGKERERHGLAHRSQKCEHLRNLVWFQTIIRRFGWRRRDVTLIPCRDLALLV